MVDPVVRRTRARRSLDTELADPYAVADEGVRHVVCAVLLYVESSSPYSLQDKGLAAGVYHIACG
jgi:hypothetical protein